MRCLLLYVRWIFVTGFKRFGSRSDNGFGIGPRLLRCGMGLGLGVGVVINAWLCTAVVLGVCAVVASELCAVASEFRAVVVSEPCAVSGTGGISPPPVRVSAVKVGDGSEVGRPASARILSCCLRQDLTVW